MMLRAQTGPRPAQMSRAPVKPGHRGRLARLIRERPVFVNRASVIVRRFSWCQDGLFQNVLSIENCHKISRLFAYFAAVGPAAADRKA